MEANKRSIILSELSHKLLGPKMTYRLRYFHQRGHFPNLSHPNDMSEILISQMFDTHFCKCYAPYVDKVKVRDFIREKGLEEILLDLYGVWNKPEEIPFDNLPSKFVLKSNNGCGHHVICSDKLKLNRNVAIETLNGAIDSGLNNIEPHYHFIEPKVFAEELIETPGGAWPIDYKFTCIGGEIMDVFVAVERATSAKYITLDLSWEVLPFTKKEYLPKKVPIRPRALDRMAEVAKVLSKDFDFVRVDLYEYRDRPYFSELTFFPWGGLLYSYTDEATMLFGKRWREITGM